MEAKTTDNITEGNIKVRKTYHLRNEETQEVLGEGGSNEHLQFSYYDNEKISVITQVVAGRITDTEVTFYFLDSYETISIPVQRIIDWIR